MHTTPPQSPKKILFICGSLNQTTQMSAIAAELPGYARSFTPFYVDGVIELLRRARMMEFTIVGARWREQCLSYLRENGLHTDFGGRSGGYDLVLTCTDLFVPQNVRRTKGVLVQEGMTDPENLIYRLVRRHAFIPRYLASTAATGLSNWYEKFCVASDGYRDLFTAKGVRPEKIVVTGIPNFDACARYRDNQFPHRGYVLVCTSDARETFKLHNRTAFLRRAVELARGRQLIIKLHPNERVDRARREITHCAPDALVFTGGNTEHMIANCDVLLTEYSSTAFVGVALGKEVHSVLAPEHLQRLLPKQNAAAAYNIARVCREALGDECSTNSTALASRDVVSKPPSQSVVEA